MWCAFGGAFPIPSGEVRIPDLALLMLSDETLQQPLLALQALPLKVARRCSWLERLLSGGLVCSGRRRLGSTRESV